MYSEPLSSCEPTIKSRKKKVKMIKNDIEELMSILDRIGIYGDATDRIVGSLYKELRWTKQEIKRMKKGKK